MTDFNFDQLFIIPKDISLSIKSSGESTPSWNEVLSMWSKSKESANRLRQIPPNTQILNTEIMLMVRIVGITIIVLLCTSVRCPSHIGISELFTLVRTFIILFCTIHWNIYWTGQRYMEYGEHKYNGNWKLWNYPTGEKGISTSSVLYPILSAM